MRTAYAHIASRAMINLTHITGATFTVDRVSVPITQPSNRGQGIASALFKEVCTEADHQGVTLILYIVPDGSPGSLGRRQLTAWYQRLGFVPDPDRKRWWIRHPKEVGSEALDSHLNQAAYGADRN
jgi:GNAT superfamily N-acetyltransferase